MNVVEVQNCVRMGTIALLFKGHRMGGQVTVKESCCVACEGAVCSPQEGILYASVPWKAREMSNNTLHKNSGALTGSPPPPVL